MSIFCEDCNDEGWIRTGEWHPLLNDAQPCYCGILSMSHFQERLAEPVKKPSVVMMFAGPEAIED